MRKGAGMTLSPGGGIGKMTAMRLAILFALISLPCCGERGDGEASGKEGVTAGDARVTVGREVRWYPSLPAAMRVAKEVKKPLMVDFFSERCGWCKVLDQKTYTDPEVRKCAEQFVSVKVDAGKSPAAAQYRVVGLPTILFMNSGGEVIHTVVGFRPPGPFLVEMRRALEKASPAR